VYNWEVMDESRTTIVVQHYLDELAAASGDSDAEPVISALLGQSAHRLLLLCAALLYRSYPRLACPPLGLAAEDLLGAVVERLLRALRETRPGIVREFFALAGRHMRWELNDLTRRLDEQGSEYAGARRGGTGEQRLRAGTGRAAHA
jgi:hypothetical protein